MADIRVVFGDRPKTGVVNVQVNVFGMIKLQAGVTGEALSVIAVKALQPAKQEAYDNWAVLTGASRDSIDVVVAEVGAKHARVALQAGGQKLISDPRNKQHIDYAPFLEFNGSPSGSQPAGVLVRAIYGNDYLIRRVGLHGGVAELIRSILT
jgi:hypothetical protein